MVEFKIYSLYLNKFRKSLAAPGKLCLDSELRWKPDIPIGLVQSYLNYGYASAFEQSTLFAIFPLIFVSFVQHPG